MTGEPVFCPKNMSELEKYWIRIVTEENKKKAEALRPIDIPIECPKWYKSYHESSARKRLMAAEKRLRYIQGIQTNLKRAIKRLKLNGTDVPNALKTAYLNYTSAANMQEACVLDAREEYCNAYATDARDVDLDAGSGTEVQGREGPQARP